MANGLNQYTSVAGTSFAHDLRGNLTNNGVKTFTYDHSNRLKTVTGGISYSYDPLSRLYQQTVGSTSTQYLYDGSDLIAEYNGNSVQKRYVHGPGMDEPLVEYQGTGTSSRTFLIADERGSIVAGTNASGAKTYINRYDEYGKPQSENQGRFQYTGQVYLSKAKLYHYKARVYDPELGRFLQTDPIGYAAGMNLYAYVGNDPMNFNDPFGLDDMELRHGRETYDSRPLILYGNHRPIPIVPPRRTYPIRRTDTDTTPQPSPFGMEYNQEVAASAVPEMSPAEELIRSWQIESRTRTIAREMCQAEYECMEEDLQLRLDRHTIRSFHRRNDPESTADVVESIADSLFGTTGKLIRERFERRCQICSATPNNPMWDAAKDTATKELIWGRSRAPDWEEKGF